MKKQTYKELEKSKKFFKFEFWSLFFLIVFLIAMILIIVVQRDKLQQENQELHNKLKLYNEVGK